MVGGTSIMEKQISDNMDLQQTEMAGGKWMEEK